jgi:hypothetical protein
LWDRGEVGFSTGEGDKSRDKGMMMVKLKVQKEKSKKRMLFGLLNVS